MIIYSEFIEVVDTGDFKRICDWLKENWIVVLGSDFWQEMQDYFSKKFDISLSELLDSLVLEKPKDISKEFAMISDIVGELNYNEWKLIKKFAGHVKAIMDFIFKEEINKNGKLIFVKTEKQDAQIISNQEVLKETKVSLRTDKYKVSKDGSINVENGCIDGWKTNLLIMLNEMNEQEKEQFVSTIINWINKFQNKKLQDGE